MNSLETKRIVHAIAQAVADIKRRLNTNTAIFSVSLLVVCITAYVTWRHDKSLEKLTILASDNYKKILETRATQDAQDQVVVHYIQDTITAINKLQADNPNIQVPKAPPIRLPGQRPPTANELTRPAIERPPPPSPTATSAPTPHAGGPPAKKKVRRALARRRNLGGNAGSTRLAEKNG